MGKLLSLFCLLIAFTSFINGEDAPRCPAGNTTCLLPDCFCSGTKIPGDYDAEDIPQIVFFSFDTGINTQNYPVYQEILAGRVNPNGAEISVTFFVTHEYNDYNLTAQLYRQGHEIALNSITRSSSTDYWRNLNETLWKAEVVDQLYQLSFMANISMNEINGMRAPHLQIGGDVMYKALYEGNISWECSRPTYNIRQPGLWPYTNDYLSIQDCQILPCPTEAYPGFWTVPMIDLLGHDGYPCPLLDTCSPKPVNASGMFDLLQKNFLEQYTGNKAPYGVFTTSALLVGTDPEYVERREGYKMFLDYLATLDDVYVVGITKGLEWVRDPTPLDEIEEFEPWMSEGIRADNCRFPQNCRYDWQGSERYMMTCSSCPPQYPWLFNPLGATPIG